MKRLRALVLLVLLAPAGVDAGETPLSERAYAGVSLRDTSDGAVVSRVRAGPFAGLVPASAALRRGDLVVTINGAVSNAAGFSKLVESSHPGDAVTFIVRRDPNFDSSAPIPKGNPAGELLEITARFESADRWLGTIGRAAIAAVPDAEEGEIEGRVRRLAERAGAWGEQDGLPQLEGFLAYLMTIQTSSRDSFAIPALTKCFARPLAIDAVEAGIARAARKLSENPDSAHFRALLSNELTPSTSTLPLEQPEAEFRRRAQSLARHLRDSVSLDGPEAQALISTVKDAPAAYARFVLEADGWSEAARWETRLAPTPRTSPISRVDLPADLQDAVQGEIFFAERLQDGRFVVVGGDGPNRYRMEMVEIVYDAGGDDIYDFVRPPESAGGESSANHIIFDLAGNDQYLGHDDFVGPGVAVCGFSLIDDRAGDDLYQSPRQFSMAAGLFGVGIILDRAGNDRYENMGADSGWSQGVGIYGVGLVMDQSGNDSYRAEKLSQGVGGPFGLGAILDARGSDTYTANGPNFPSGYGTPGVFLSMSQGFGMGIRDYASGGIGAIYDFGGDDHYNAGEFSQGCGYSFGIGVLHDFAGNDVYDGNRYSQAAAAHQAVGILIDDEGNDRYVGKTAASQSGSWDQSITLLVDRAGDDMYRADDLCQGAAAQQALAMFFDLAGSDRYEAAGGPDKAPGDGASVQGASGSNEYHFPLDHCFSFSLLSDSGPGQNSFSTGRIGLLRTGRLNENRESSRWLGVFSQE